MSLSSLSSSSSSGVRNASGENHVNVTRGSVSKSDSTRSRRSRRRSLLGPPGRVPISEQSAQTAQLDDETKKADVRPKSSGLDGAKPSAPISSTNSSSPGAKDDRDIKKNPSKSAPSSSSSSSSPSSVSSSSSPGADVDAKGAPQGDSSHPEDAGKRAEENLKRLRDLLKNLGIDDKKNTNHSIYPKKAEEEEAEAAKRAKEEAKKKAEEDAKKKAVEEAKKKAEEESKKRAEEESSLLQLFVSLRVRLSSLKSSIGSIKVGRSLDECKAHLKRLTTIEKAIGGVKGEWAELRARVDRCGSQRVLEASNGLEGEVSDVKTRLEGKRASIGDAMEAFTRAQDARHPPSHPHSAPAIDGWRSSPTLSTCQVNGHTYVDLGRIAKGGSCMVHRVLSERRQICALKVVKLKGKSEGERTNLIHGCELEIEFLRSLRDSPHIVQLLDVEFKSEAIVLLMELGEIDLHQLLIAEAKRPRKPTARGLFPSGISANSARMFWQQMLEAVQTVHDSNIVHADLKPANFVLFKGQLKLIDFGISNKLPDPEENDTTSIIVDQVKGTLNYMAPENFDQTPDGAKIGRACDVWSLGCILYKMVYGKAPFEKYGKRTNMGARIGAICRKQVDYAEVETCTAVIDIMKRCLQRDPKSRPKIADLLNHEWLRT